MANADSQFRISVHLPVNRPKRTPFTELTKAKLDFRFWCAQVTAEGDEIVRQKQRARSLEFAQENLGSPHAQLAPRSARPQLHGLVDGSVALTAQPLIVGLLLLTVPRGLCHVFSAPFFAPLSSAGFPGLHLFLGVLPHSMFILGVDLADGDLYSV